MEVCEECEDNQPQIMCQQCGQVLCQICDKKIHNKGKRLLHIRDELKSYPASEKSEQKSLNKQDAHLIRYQQQQDRFNQHQKQFQEQTTEESQTKVKNKPLKKLNLQAPSLVIEEEGSFQTNVYSHNYFKFKHPSVSDLLKNYDIPLQCPSKFKNHNILGKIENYLRNRGNQGDLMIHLEEFSRYLKSKEIHKINNSKDVIVQLENLKLIHITTRKFGDSEPIQFVSLLLDSLTLESLSWILKSIRRDQMTPTDKLIASRIKECFGIKMTNQEWNLFLQSLLQLQDEDGIIKFTVKRFTHKKEIDQEVAIKIKKCPLELISNNTNMSQSKNTSFDQLKDSSFSQNEQLHLFTLEDSLPWDMIDTKNVFNNKYKYTKMSYEFKSQWKLFIQFLRDFFDRDTGLSSVHEEGTQSEAALSAEFRINVSSHTTSSQSDKFKWVRSVESTINKQTDNTVTQLFSNQSYLSEKPKKKLKKTAIKPPKSISKAIPGGKYGCAQLLKCCGPLPLRICSLGLLCLLIQEAISRGILIYYKTLLIKPNQNISFDFGDYLCIFDEKYHQNILDNNDFQDQTISNEKQAQLQNQQEKSKKVKQAILDILSDQHKGVSLARLPKLIQRRLLFTFDLHELGFTKLKQFVQTIQEITIENDGTTHASVILKEFLQTDMSPSTYNKKFQTLKGDSKQTFANYFQKSNLSSVNEYQIKVDAILKQILNQNPCGIASSQLLTLLNEKLQTTFDHTLFGCNSFEEYLVKQAESFADVLVKMSGCIVYPKGWQGWVWQQSQQLQQQQSHPIIRHQKSASTTNQINQIQNSSSQTIKADSHDNLSLSFLQVSLLAWFRTN